MKNLILSLITIIYFHLFTFSQDQFLLQENFNNGVPTQWQSQSIQGNNQWLVTNNAGENINGTDMAFIESVPNQATVTHLVLPPMQSDPGIETIELEMTIQQFSTHPTFLNVLLIEDGNPIPIVLEQFDIPSCNPSDPWSCNPDDVTIEIPSPLNSNDQIILEYESNTPDPEVNFVGIDDIEIFGFLGCPVELQLLSSINPTCNGDFDGSISVVANFGAPPYIFSINDGPGQASGIFTDLPSGVYNITVIDNNACTDILSVLLGDLPVLSFTALPTNELCDMANGSIAITADGGNPNFYQYQLDNGIPQFNSVFNNLAAGIYNVTVIDGSNCQVSGIVQLQNIGGYSLETTQAGPTCNGGNNGQITVSGSGGLAPYSYTLNGGSPNTTGVWLNLSAGVYNVIVTDALGCVESVSLSLADPAPISFIEDASPPTCFNGGDGMIDGSTSGPSNGGAFMYSLDGGPFQNSPVFMNLNPGFYLLDVKNELNCQKTFLVEVPNAEEMVIGINSTDLLDCSGDADGIIDVFSVLFATAPLTYELDGVNGGPTWNNLAAGTYQVKVIDFNACQKTENVTIEEPDALTIGLAETDLTCSSSGDGEIDVNIFGGTPPIEYNFNGSSFGPYTAPFTIIDLDAGIYPFQAKDFNDCMVSNSVTVEQPDQVVSDTVSVTSSAGMNGAIDAQTSGGEAPYSYLWSNGESTQDIQDLNPGTYYLLTSDLNGCTADTLFVDVDPLCSAANFSSVPDGLEVNQNIAGGTKTQLLWDHYSDRTDGCLLKGGTIASLDPAAAFTQNPGNVLIQGVMVDGNNNGKDFSAQLSPDAQYQLFNPNTFPSGFTSNLVPGAFYKFQVRCGCIIDPTISGSARFAATNVHLSPWSPFKEFTNLSLFPQIEDSNTSNQFKSIERVFSIFPNPTKGKIEVNLSNKQNHWILLIIRNTKGQIVQSLKPLNGAINQMDLTELDSGIYILEMQSENEIISHKIVKQ